MYIISHHSHARTISSMYRYFLLEFCCRNFECIIIIIIITIYCISSCCCCWLVGVVEVVVVLVVVLMVVVVEEDIFIKFVFCGDFFEILTCLCIVWH